jgi:hypothetical protein
LIFRALCDFQLKCSLLKVLNKYSINRNPMEKLLNDQVLEIDMHYLNGQQNDLMLVSEKLQKEHQSEIENGNVRDYLEIYGELEDI